MSYIKPNYQEGWQAINLANDLMCQNAPDPRDQKFPEGDCTSGGYHKEVGIVEYLANLNSTDTWDVYLNPNDYHDYFIFQRGNNKDVIPDHYINLGGLHLFDFDGDEMAAEFELDLLLDSDDE
jgi:hypothetical protein